MRQDIVDVADRSVVDPAKRPLQTARREPGMLLERGSSSDNRNGPVTESRANPEIYQFVGSALYLMSRSPLRRNWSVADVERLVLPPVRLRQCLLFSKGEQPFGYVSWAWMTDVASAAYEAGGRLLEASDWNGGKNLWFVDFIVPFGGARELIWELRRKRFRGLTARSIRRAADGGIERIVRLRAPGASTTVVGLADPVESGD